METYWFEDPAMDGHVERLPDGKRIAGDDWRQLEWLRMRAAQRGAKGEVIGVAGTTHYARAVESIGTRAWGPAHLVPEPDNPHNKKALCVVVGDAHVGYVPDAKLAQVSPDATAHVVKSGMGGAPHVWLWVESA